METLVTLNPSWNEKGYEMLKEIYLFSIKFMKLLKQTNSISI